MTARPPERPRPAQARAASQPTEGPTTGRASALRSPLHPAWWLIPLALLEFAWIAWYLSALLPNARNLGAFARRGVLLLNAFPGVIPGVSWNESLLGVAIGKLARLEYLPQRLQVLMGAALIGSAAIALGDLALRLIGFRRPMSPGERIALGYGVGCTLLGVFTLGLGRAGLLNAWLIRAALLAIVAGGLAVSQPWRSWRAWGRAFIPDASWSPVLAVLPFLWLMFLGSMLPSIDFDVIEYHLQGPKEYFQAGRIRFLPHNVYTSMPFGVEMLHLLGMEVLDDWWWGALVGQLLVMAFAPATAALVAATAWRGGSRRAGWIAAIVYLSTPWIYRLALIAYVEGPLCFFHAALVWAVVCGWRRESAPGGSPAGESEPKDSSWRRHFFRTLFRDDWNALPLLLGLLAGGAMACKYPGLISAVVPFGLLMLDDTIRRRSPRPLLMFALGWGVVMGPWLGKNVLDTGNPVYPLEYRIFGGRHWDDTLDAKFRNGHARQEVSLSKLVDSAVEVAGKSDWQSGLYLALAPLALLRPGSRRLAAALWLYILYLFLTWWLLTHRLDRFWLPLLAPLAVLAGLGGDWIRGRGWTSLLSIVLTVHLLTNFVYDTTSHAGFNEWTADLLTLRRDLPRRMDAPLAAVDERLPADERILVVGQAAVFPVNHPIVYNTVFNRDTLETLAKDRSPEEFHRALRNRNISHIYIDWQEIRRYRQPFNYGYTDFVTPDRLKGWVAAGILEGPTYLDPQHELYRVR